MSSADAQPLRLLGGLDAATAQPKRIALLAYLALAQPRGLHQRDALLALLWSDLDEARARAALSQTLYALRRTFGEDLFQKRGQQIGLTPGMLAVDAVSFEAAAQAGDAERALELYVGDLLPSFHVSSAPEFEQWLEVERQRLRTLARRAARSLSDAAWRREESAAAVSAARRGYELSDHAEEELRHLLALQQEAGDIAGALATYDAHVREHGADVEARTAEIVRLLRSMRAKPVATEPVTAPRPRRWLPAAAIVLVLLSVLVVLRPWARFASAAVDPVRIAVLPFTVRGDESLGYMSDGMVDLLGARLDGSAELRVVDAFAVLQFLERRQTGDERQQALAVLQHFGAGLYVAGTLVRAGERIEATAALYDRDGEVVGRGTATAANEDEIAGMVDELARNLLSARFTGPAERLQRVAAATTSSYPALRAYLEGEALLREAQHDAALAAYSRAVALDSTFALAHYRVAVLADWVGTTDLISPSLTRAVRHSGRLGDHERRLVHAFERYWHGPFEEVENAYARLVEDYPDDVEAWHHYGEVLFHWGPMMGRSGAEARRPFERVIALNPEDASAPAHLARIAALEGRWTEADSMLRQAQRVAPDLDRTPELHLLHAYVRRDTARFERLVDELDQVAEYNVWVAAWRVAAATRDPEAGIAIIAANRNLRRTEEARLVALQSTAHFQAALGRFADAERTLAEAAIIDAHRAAATGAFLTALPFSPVGPGRIAELRAQLSAAPQGRRFERSRLPTPRVHQQNYRIFDALLGLRAGDTVPARRLLGGAQIDTVSYASMLRALRGHPLLASPADLEVRRDRSSFRRDAEYTYALEFWQLAERIERAGRLEQALTLYDSFGSDFSYDIVFHAPAKLRRAEILSRLGRRDEAAREYREFLRLWRHADPDLQPTVARARAQLAALTR